jgi:NADH pyrophosphatase NudC (nudix superfamily)
MSQDFIAKIIPPTQLTEPARWFVFCQQQILLYQDEVTIDIPQHTDFPALGLSIIEQQYLGIWQNQHCFCAEILLPQQLPENFILQPFRQAALHFNNDKFELASRALQLLRHYRWALLNASKFVHTVVYPIIRAFHPLLSY